ncbi:MAG: tail completion protein gp17, partial [Planctomycetota bacterium]
QVKAWPEESTTRTGPEFIQRNNCYHGYTNFAYDGSTTKTCAEWVAYGLVDDSGELDATDPLLADPGAGDFSLEAGSPCRHAGIGAGVLTGYLRGAFDAVRPDIGAASTGTVETPSRPSAEVDAVDDDTITVNIEGDAGAEHRAELVRARTGEIVDSESRDGDGQVALTAPELCARYFVVASSANAAGRSLPSLPCEVIVPEAEGPLEEVRIGIVSRLTSHAGLAEILGTDETGAVAVYAAGPERPKRLPCVVYTLSGVPDGELDRAGRWVVTLELEAWGGSAGVNDSVVGALDEVLHRQPFNMTSWTVKRIGRTGGGTRWADDGRIEIRHTTWSLVVDRRVT